MTETKEKLNQETQNVTSGQETKPKDKSDDIGKKSSVTQKNQYFQNESTPEIDFRKSQSPSKLI